MKYRDFEIKPIKHTNPWYVNGKYIYDGWTVVKNHCNIMPAACWFQTQDEACIGIDAYLLAGNPEDKGFGDKFWAILDIADGRFERAALSIDKLLGKKEKYA